MGLTATLDQGMVLMFAVTAVVTIYTYSLIGVITVVSVILGIIIYDVERNRVVPNQSFGSALHHYLTVNSIFVLGFVMKNRFDSKAKTIKRTQEDMLLKQLKRNANTEYGLKYNFSSITSAKDFVKRHPLTTYNHFEEYVTRMVNGENNVLTTDKPSIFAVTSGTSGKSKIMPMVKRQNFSSLLNGISIMFFCMTTAFPALREIRKSLKFFYTPKWRESASGIKIGPNSSTPSRTKGILHIYSTPTAAYDITSEPEALYIHLLFALKYKHLGMLEANFSSIIFNSFRTMVDKMDSLIEDIEQGRLTPDLCLDESVRERLNSLLKPDPERAAELKAAYKYGIVGLARRCWPSLIMVLAADSGTFEIYGKKLRETYLKDVLLYSPIYAASEGLLGINIWPSTLPSRYILIPTTQFFEFIPVNSCDEEQPETVFMHEVKLNQEYELVITNLSCMYRYRFGDVIKVTDFYNQCPVVEFRYRIGQFLNVRGEKTSEATLSSALRTCLSSWSGAQLVDYCCAESVYVEDTQHGQEENVPCYHVFLELDQINNSDVKLNLNQIDETLCRQSYVYSSFRKKGSIGPMKVHLLRSGSFSELRLCMINNTPAAAVQYKVPRALKRTEIVQFMMNRVL